MNKARSNRKSLAAIILAAGEGRRIGMPKWQIEHNGKNFLKTIVDKLQSSFIDDVICVKRQSFDIRLDGILYVDNLTPEFGMISSLYYAVQAYPKFDAYLILPVDHPFIEVSTIIELRKSFELNPSKVVRPTYNGIPGHPIIIPNALVSYIKTPDYEGGLRQLIRDSNAEMIDIPVNDANILRNINIASDLK